MTEIEEILSEIICEVVITVNEQEQSQASYSAGASGIDDVKLVKVKGQRKRKPRRHEWENLFDSLSNKDIPQGKRRITKQ